MNFPYCNTIYLIIIINILIYCWKILLTFLYTYQYKLLAVPTQLLSMALISAYNIVAHYCILNNVMIKGMKYARLLN